MEKGDTLFMLPEVPNQPKAYETCLPSFLQSPLKNRCVRILPWERGNESPRLRFVWEYTTLLNELMRFLGGQPSRERAGWQRAESRNREQMENNFQARLCSCWAFHLAQIPPTLHVTSSTKRPPAVLTISALTFLPIMIDYLLGPNSSSCPNSTPSKGAEYISPSFDFSCDH